MYYWSCVENTLELDDADSDIYSRYDLHFLMTKENKRRLLALCLLVSPDILDDSCFFQRENIDSQNEFYELDQVQTSLAAVSNILIGGVNRKVRRIMIYKRNWMLRYYFWPIFQLENELSNFFFYIELKTWDFYKIIALQYIYINLCLNLILFQKANILIKLISEYNLHNCFSVTIV